MQVSILFLESLYWTHAKITLLIMPPMNQGLHHMIWVSDQLQLLAKMEEKHLFLVVVHRLVTGKYLQL